MEIIGNKEYDVKINKMFIQPHLMINDYTTDVGMWADANEKERLILLEKAAECYEYNKKMETLKDNNPFHMHKSEEKIEEDVKPKNNWWSRIFKI